MKSSVFALLVVIGVLLMGGVAWTIGNGGESSRDEAEENAAHVSAPLEAWQEPLENYTVALAYGAAYDETHRQWFTRDYTLLASDAGAAVRAMKSGRIAASAQEDGVWSVSVEHADGTTTVYGGLTNGAREGRNIDGGEIIGFLAGDTLALRWRKDGVWADPAPLLA